MGIYSVILEKDAADLSSHAGVEARNALYACIESGDADNIDRVFHAFEASLLELIQKDVSTYKLTVNYLLAQLEIVAVRGGLSLIQCSSLQEKYYRAIERADSPKEATALLREQCVELTSLIRDCKKLSSLTRECCAYIQNHIYEELSLPSVAQALRYSESYLSHRFKEEMGKTVNQYVRDIRIAQAKQLLRQGLAVSQVAAMLRFSSQSHFTAAFRKNTGLTPALFRKQHTGSDS